MFLLVVGVLLLIAKMADLGPTAGWSWWVVAAPFIGAVLWWRFVDFTGITKRRAMQRMDDRKAERRDRSLQALGLGTRPGRGQGKRGDAPRKQDGPARGSDPTQRDSGL